MVYELLCIQTSSINIADVCGSIIVCQYVEYTIHRLSWTE